MAGYYTWDDIIIDPTSDRAKEAVGKECYFDNNPGNVLGRANYGDTVNILPLKKIEPDSSHPFIFDGVEGSVAFSCIVVKKEMPYSERAKQWIEENNLKVDDYVKVLRKAKDFESGWDATWNDLMNKSVCKILKITEVRFCNGHIILEDGYRYPYFVLEKVEPPKPKYVPFESIEEFIEAFDDHTHSDKDSIINTNLYLSGFWLKNIKRDNPVYKQVIAIQDVSVLIGTIEYLYPALLENFTFLDGTPCGKEVEE